MCQCSFLCSVFCCDVHLLDGILVSFGLVVCVYMCVSPTGGGGGEVHTFTPYAVLRNIAKQ
jgi:hypothetical protein